LSDDTLSNILEDVLDNCGWNGYNFMIVNKDVVDDISDL